MAIRSLSDDVSSTGGLRSLSEQPATVEETPKGPKKGSATEAALYLSQGLSSVPRAFLHSLRQAGGTISSIPLPAGGQVGSMLPARAREPISDKAILEESARLKADPTYDPVAGLVGQVGAASLIPGAGSATLLPRALAGVAQGGLFADPGQRLTGAAVGGIGAAALPAALKWTTEKLNAAKNIVANKFLSRGGRMAPMEPGAVEAAYEAGAIKPFSSPKSAYEKLANALSKVQREKYGPMMKEFEQAGVEGMSAEDFVRALENRYQEVAKGTTVPQFYHPYSAEAQNIGMNVPATEATAAHFAPNALRPPQPSGNFPLSQGESLKSGYQHMAKQAYNAAPGMPISGSGVAYEDIAAIAREMQERAVEAQAAKAPEAAKAFIPVKREYGNLAQAKAAAAMAATRAANRGLLGLPESMAIGGLISGGLEHPGRSIARMIGVRAGREHIAPTLGYLSHQGEQLTQSMLENLPLNQRLMIELLRRKTSEEE